MVIVANSKYLFTKHMSVYSTYLHIDNIAINRHFSIIVTSLFSHYYDDLICQSRSQALKLPVQRSEISGIPQCMKTSRQNGLIYWPTEFCQLIYMSLIHVVNEKDNSVHECFFSDATLSKPLTNV